MHPTRIFKAPDELAKAWEGYLKWLESESRKWPKVQYVGKEGQQVVDYPKMPYTFEGFKRYCYLEYGCVEQYFVNKDGLYDEFVSICSRIKEWIREDQITGGLLGNYNASITQRLNGLKELTDATTKAEVRILNIDPLDDSADNKP